MSNTEAIRNSRMHQIIELFDFFELSNDERLMYIMEYCADECTLSKAKCSELKNLLDFLNEQKRVVFNQLKKAAVEVGCVQKDNNKLMDAWEIDRLLHKYWNTSLSAAKVSHIKKVIHLLYTGEILL